MRINEISLFSFNNHLSRSVGTVYSLYIHSIKLVHTLFTACTYTLYSLHIQFLKRVHTFFTACTMYIHSLQHVQCTYTLFSKYIQSLQLVYGLFTAVYIYSLQLVHTLYTACTYTLYCLYIHSLEQVHTLYTACTYTPYSLQYTTCTLHKLSNLSQSVLVLQFTHFEQPVHLVQVYNFVTS